MLLKSFSKILSSFCLLVSFSSDAVFGYLAVFIIFNCFVLNVFM